MKSFKQYLEEKVFKLKVTPHGHQKPTEIWINKGSNTFKTAVKELQKISGDTLNPFNRPYKDEQDFRILYNFKDRLFYTWFGVDAIHYTVKKNLNIAGNATSFIFNYGNLDFAARVALNDMELKKHKDFFGSILTSSDQTYLRDPK